ncbi:GCN5-related N-acetyltransferase [Pseudopedobacter saltans DSM 12145]|uniref:GCN5-related N-acetyltransferase n=1 Tax=Pseudopedobacter saltans (strain ATCC 51119 / DSM 12145 / JCM 21818 / CCUG 39354 / LMG 10337 / NBRC 100064 / NCIMB 13643) TaxID=762903 RepID=F0S767_PSESL|nr:GNAT family protein [Pseudopedobacter saltans]ADY54340.1 GCN5-related N-acetyltransferase [Pseudopedobacter saltans DSM 12145]
MIKLSPFEITDFEQLASWAETEEILMQFAGPAYQFPLTKEQVQDSLAEADRLLFKVVDQASGNTIGHAQILNKEHSFSLGRIIIGDKLYRGKGIGQILVRQLLEYGFMNLDQEIAELNVFDWNVAAVKCYEKIGFKINPDVSYQREVKGEIWTAVNMKISRALYHALR